MNLLTSPQTEEEAISLEFMWLQISRVIMMSTFCNSHLNGPQQISRSRIEDMNVFTVTWSSERWNLSPIA
ncbi:hypothetical protein KIN20_024896 [Parelaphostrongylus tenuis]|uniref:Uncharacterized protein n=1 Tax=Parelaphostrongylus tenuis TaxID=148309 RepID=A0AAD5MU78_PARTN|nr:hypothetical protein KIN20_024896 [Parelaphostrongylus tenuis]